MRGDMAITCNFESEENSIKQDGKLIVRIPPGHRIGGDEPGVRTSKSCAYMWVIAPRHPARKSWRRSVAIN